MSGLSAPEPEAASESRIAPVLSILTAAAGLGTYVAVAGGVAEWARVGGAGLAATQALASIEPITLLASGFQVIGLVVVILIAAWVVAQVAEDLEGAPSEIRGALIVRRSGQFLSQIVILGMAAYVTLVPTMLVAGLFVVAAGSWPAAATCAVAVGCCAFLSARRVLGLAKEIEPVALTPSPRAKAVPLMLRVTFESAARRPRLVASVAATLVAVCVGIIAIAAMGRVARVSAEVYLGALAGLWVVLTVVVLAAAGGFLLRKAATRDKESEGAGTVDGQRPDDARVADDRARFSFVVAAALVGALFVLPLAWGVFVVGVMLMALFLDQLASARWRGLLAGALVFALGLMGYQAHSPQRFDRLDFSVSQGAGKPRLAVRVALIGRRGDAYLVGACDRARTTVRGMKGWKSTAPRLLSFTKDDAVDGEVVSGRYAFFQPTEPSVAGAVLSMIDIGVRPHALISSATLYAPFADPVTRDVCGGVAGSAARAREAAGVLARLRVERRRIAESA